MPGQFLHGVELVEIDDGARPIRTVKSSVIGIVGTADNADETVFPLNTPVAIFGSRTAAASLDTVGTKLGSLPRALDAILAQVGAAVVVIRVAEDATPATEQSNVITGIGQLPDAQSVTGLQPRIIIAPEYSGIQAVDTALQTAAERLRAIAVIDDNSTTAGAANTYAANFGSKRLFMVSPHVTYYDTVTAGTLTMPASPFVAGLIAKTDNDKGFWWSPSNQVLNNVLNTDRPISFGLGDANSEANTLNENHIATVIRSEGYRLWGNHTLSGDAKWQFINVTRTADIINDSIQRAHQWAVDRNITKNYIEAVTESVNAYLRELTALGAILGGECWADPELNTPSAIAKGEVYFDFDFTPPSPAEHITFRSHLVNDYLTEIF